MTFDEFLEAAESEFRTLAAGEVVDSLEKLRMIVWVEEFSGGSPRPDLPLPQIDGVEDLYQYHQQLAAGLD